MPLLSRKTLDTGVFLLLSVCFYTSASNSATAASCRNGDFDRTARVKHVIDGDTLFLENREKIRLIGIDTPELGRDGKPDEPGARAAKARLEMLLGADKRIRLQYGRQRRDRHGRALAYVFMANGVNIQQSLLSAGLATPLTIPPNLDYLPCYQKAAQLAREQGRGLWSDPDYQIKRAETLGEYELGYRQILGTVTRLGQSKSSVWLELGRALVIRIRRADLVYFNTLDLEELVRQTVLVRGRVYRVKDQLRIRISHPSALSIQPDKISP